MIVVEHWLLPAALVTVKVYVIVAVGDTAVDPPNGLTDPKPLFRFALVAFIVAHESMDD